MNTDDQSKSKSKSKSKNTKARTCHCGCGATVADVQRDIVKASKEQGQPINFKAAGELIRSARAIFEKLDEDAQNFLRDADNAQAVFEGAYVEQAAGHTYLRQYSPRAI